MNPFKYSDHFISETEFGFALPSVMIGVAALSLPSDIASATSFGDGWVAILLAGVIFTVFALLAVKIGMYFPDQSFLTYTSFLLTRPVAIIITFSYIIIGIFMMSYTLRSVAFISQQYLFETTPMSVLALCFLLVVIYAVTGERVGIFRLNILFLPLILSIFLIVGFFNIKWFEVQNVLPMFKTDLAGYVKGTKKTFEAYIGYGLGLFYIFLIRNPKKLTSKVITGMSVVTLFYLFIFISSISVFGNLVTSNLAFPTIELAKRVEIPGGIFERIDALIFTIWVMAIFNTAAIILDVVVLLLCSIFTKADKKIVGFILSPIIFYISMFPEQINQVKYASSTFSKVHIYYTFLIIILLFVMTKIRGAKHHNKS